jgi:hypothetical protein
MHGDGSLDAADLRKRLIEAVRAAGGVNHFSARTGIDKRPLHDALHGRRPVSDKIARSLGFSRADLKFVRYIPADADEAHA